MKLNIQTKLFIGFVGILLLTIALVYFLSQHFITRGIEDFMGGESFKDFPGFDKGHGDRLKEDMQMYLIMVATIGSSLAIVITFILSKYLVAPIKNVIETTKRIAKGDYKTRVKVSFKDEIGELCVAVNKMAEGLEETERLRRELVSNVAHELATPLTNISGYLEAMQDGTISDKKLTGSTMKLLKDETNRLTAMVDDVRALSSIENPRMKLKIKAHDPQKLIKQVLARMKPKFKKRDIDLQVEDTDDLPKILVDKEKFYQIMINLISNAITYSPEKGKINITAKHKSDAVCITVEDNGMGIPKKDLPHIFERFYRTDKSRSRRTGGTGVGLTIVKELVEAHGGDVEVKSEVGKGTKFTCRFLVKAR